MALKSKNLKGQKRPNPCVYKTIAYFAVLNIFINERDVLRPTISCWGGGGGEVKRLLGWSTISYMGGGVKFSSF